MVRPAPRLRDDVVNGEVAEGEQHLASSAQPFLLPEQYVLVLAVGDGCFDVGPPGYIGAGGDVAVMKKAAHSLLQAHVDQLHGLGGYVYANPAALQLVGGNASRGTATEGVKDGVIRVAAGLDDALQEG